MVIDCRIEIEREKISIQRIQDVLNGFDTLPPKTFVYVTPLPQVNEDYKQTLRDIGNILGAPIASYVPSLAIDELNKRRETISKIIEEALLPRTNGEKEEIKGGEGMKQSTPQLPDKFIIYKDMPYGIEKEVKEKINAILEHLQQKEEEGK